MNIKPKGNLNGLMDTPITISSTLSSIGKSQKKVAIPHSESSIVRIPVSWDIPLKPCDRETSCTPSTLQKVNNWINSLSRVRDNVESSSGSLRPSSDSSDVDTQNEFRLQLLGDLARGRNNMSDCNKSDPKDQRADEECENYCRSPHHFKNAKESSFSSRTPNEAMCSGGLKKHFHSNASKRRKSSQNDDLLEKDDDDDDKSEEYDSDEPLSPESEKKKELCSYLQLMKPSDKKTVMILQNRRSMRVKNLSIMQEKRDLEKKLRDANAEMSNEKDLSDNNAGGEQTCPGLKTFNEMNVNLDKKYKWLKYSGSKHSAKSFNFPKPANNLGNSVNDFDDVKVCWFEKSKEEAQNNRHKHQIEGVKPHTNTIPEYFKFKKIKIKVAKLQYLSEANGDVKRKVEPKPRKTIEDNKHKTKIIDNNQRGKDNGSRGKRKDSSKTNKALGPHNVNNFKKTRLQSKSTSAAEFLVPRPSSHLMHGVNDFDAIIAQKRGLMKSNSLPSSSVKATNNIKKKNKVLNSSNSISVPISSIQLENKKSTTDHKVLNSPKPIVHPIKKKDKAKKLNTERMNRRSSFKIKLQPRRKSLGTQNKNEKKLLRGKSILIADIIRSLRNRNIETPTSEINSLKNAIKKKKNFINKKENIKRKVVKSTNEEPKVKPKNSENDCLKVSLKVPLKDTNKNPVKSTNRSRSTTPIVKDVNYKINNEDSKSLTNVETSRKLYSQQYSVSDVDFCNLSSEHKTSLLVKDTNRRYIPLNAPIIAIYHKNNNSQSVESASKAKNQGKGEFYSQIINIEKYPSSGEEDLADTRKPVHKPSEENKNRLSSLETRAEDDSEPRSPTRKSERSSTPISSKEKSDVNSDNIRQSRNDGTPFILFKKDVDVTSLHKCLNVLTPKSTLANLEVENSPTSWSSESPNHKRKKSEHSINIFKEHGSVVKAFYLEYNLVLCQEFMVSFWTQTALGNVLGAQNMWIHKGSVQRMAMNNNCAFKESLEMVVSTDNTVAYIELWTKEHQSDIREGPVADVFATVYFWKKGQNGLDKKVLQLENINGFADDVQYSVIKSTPKIIVSWHLACNELESKKTYIHCYQLAADYQKVCNISEFEAVEHYVSSLHNIEGCDSLIMGCGENKITLWNIEYGYVVATVEMTEIKSPLSTLWVKCDRGFLFTLQQCVDRELRLIAIHGMNHSWKKLASYVPPDDYDRLKGVCVENGIVLAFYDQGILCWNAQTAETVLEESHNEAEYISGKYVISVVNDQVNIRHAITHLLSAEDL